MKKKKNLELTAKQAKYKNDNKCFSQSQLSFLFLHCESQSTFASLGCPPALGWSPDLVWGQLRL